MSAIGFEPGLFARGIVPPPCLTDYKLIAFDMNPTLIDIECIDEIAGAVGRKPEGPPARCLPGARGRRDQLSSAAQDGAAAP